MNTFPCRLYLCEVLWDAELYWVRWVQLPFAPYPGLVIVLNDDESVIFKVDRVEWSVENGAFWCVERRDRKDGGCPCRPEDDCCVANPDHIQWMKDSGWELEAERRDEDRAAPGEEAADAAGVPVLHERRQGVT